MHFLTRLTLLCAGVLAFAGITLHGVNAQEAQAFQLTSPDIKEGETLNNEQVFSGMGCQGENISPLLQWTGAPSATKSLAVTVYDPDAPTGSGWWHWVVFNLPPSVSELPKNAGQTALKLLPQAALQSRTDYGKTGYGGACPPTGDAPHHYQFTVWALDVETLPLNANASGAMVGYYLNQHALGKASLTATYQRAQ